MEDCFAVSSGHLLLLRRFLWFIWSHRASRLFGLPAAAGNRAPQSSEDSSMADAIAVPQLPPGDTDMLDVSPAGSTPEDASPVDADAAGRTGQQPPMLRRFAAVPLLPGYSSSNDLAVDQRPHVQGSRLSSSISVERTRNEVIIQYNCACGQSCQIRLMGKVESFYYKCDCRKSFEIRLP